MTPLTMQIQLCARYHYIAQTPPFSLTIFFILLVGLNYSTLLYFSFFVFVHQNSITLIYHFLLFRNQLPVATA